MSYTNFKLQESPTLSFYEVFLVPITPTLISAPKFRCNHPILNPNRCSCSNIRFHITTGGGGAGGGIAAPGPRVGRGRGKLHLRSFYPFLSHSFICLQNGTSSSEIVFENWNFWQSDSNTPRICKHLEKYERKSLANLNWQLFKYKST